MGILFLALLSLLVLSVAQFSGLRGAEPEIALGGLGGSEVGFGDYLWQRLLSIKTDWHTGESVTTINGVVPRTTCPRGKYRIDSGSNLASTNRRGVRRDGCIPCPRGTYGSTEGLTSSTCTGSCPKGRYSDRLGLTTDNDCLKCPVGRYGSSLGLTTKACTGSCTSGYYTVSTGAEADSECVVCPSGYSEYPCDQGMAVRETRNGA